MQINKCHVIINPSSLNTKQQNPRNVYLFINTLVGRVNGRSVGSAGLRAVVCLAAPLCSQAYQSGWMDARAEWHSDAGQRRNADEWMTHWWNNYKTEQQALVGGKMLPPAELPKPQRLERETMDANVIISLFKCCKLFCVSLRPQSQRDKGNNTPITSQHCPIVHFNCLYGRQLNTILHFMF